MIQFMIFIFRRQIEKWKLRPFQGLRLSFIGFPGDEKNHMEEMSIENGMQFQTAFVFIFPG